MDRLREEFEKWFNKEMVLHISASNETVVRLMWKAWQASRAAIVVGLPEKDDLRLAGDASTKVVIKFRNSAIDECAESIRSIGLSIKGE
ncbi:MULTISPECIES: hypothetical protein [Serratia]|uniref:hypothetical protein n=1 Tax=Serratia TaxID=613 RepID=UPI0027E4DD8B|nr:hypothetical protein [Serratia marcescens]MCW7560812.1 hypothetical protein [Serratia marcescens]MCW7565639.1 hypothetical protein [Serratia marcescens]MCW7570640.1 hypothetical protein [Serratia marcescens]MCW7575893.1 hypothetical protein [Serratia marcescens]MCW7580640.1 hypothetical protein [Serratia marcescens]